MDPVLLGVLLTTLTPTAGIAARIVALRMRMRGEVEIARIGQRARSEVEIARIDQRARSERVRSLPSGTRLDEAAAGYRLTVDLCPGQCASRSGGRRG